MKRISIALGLLAALCEYGQTQAPETFWSSPRNFLLMGVERLAQNDAREAIPLLQDVLRLDPRSKAAHAWLAQAYHLERRLDEAARHYRSQLAIDPSRAPDPARRDAILRFAPRVAQVSSDPFTLKDVVAVHHPEEPLISYHFFWEDDIDFPSDNDPCDHELVWVRYDPESRKLAAFHTYFHGRILSTEESLSDAARNGERARVFVQWGKHGSLPVGWEKLEIQANAGDIERRYLNLERPSSLLEYNRATHEKLRREGRQHAGHPRTRSWPIRFEGTWEEFVRFEREHDIGSRLEKTGMMAVSRWNNAAIQQDFLAYNFRPKTEWPEHPARPRDLEAQLERRIGATGDHLMSPAERVSLRRSSGFGANPFLAAVGAGNPQALRDLPPMSLFQPETPRFPNVWIAAPVTRFQSYADLVHHLDVELRARAYESIEVGLSEGADLALSVEHLEPWGAVHGLRHAHDLHVRLFWKRLERAGKHRIELARSGRKEWFWLVAGSVHYEVEHAHPLHADVEVCPHCGRTGAYAAKEGNLVEWVHDPIGVELFLRGEVHGREVRRLAGRKVAGVREILGLTDSDIELARPARTDMNTEAVALVFLPSTPRR